MESAILANVVRGETLESIHRGHLFICDGEGKEIFRLGDPNFFTFFRSAAKPLQVMPFLLSGGAEKYGFTDAEIAIACGSHSGEVIHVERSAAMLEKCGLDKNALRCGSHLPFNEQAANEMIKKGEAPNALYNNCSGKHSAMLAFAKYINSDIASYEAFGHPIQLQILEIVKRFCEFEDIKLAVDGCAAPNFAMPLANMAKGYAKLISPPPDYDDKLRAACKRIVAAMMEHPEMVGGSDRLDTLIMQKLKGKIISKIGAEGIWLAGILPSEKWKKGLGIAMKIEDGDDKRARPAAAIELLRQLGILEDNSLEQFSPMPITNRRGDGVGRIEAAFKLV